MASFLRVEPPLIVEYVLDSQRIMLAVQHSLGDRTSFPVIHEGVADLVGDGSENPILVVKTRRHVGTVVVHVVGDRD